MAVDSRTVQVYDTSAKELSEYFSGIGSRTNDIHKAFSLADLSNEPLVVEIGCGDGRDAQEIVKRASSYIGLDPSIGMLEIARKRVPGAIFIQADALGFSYPKNVDIVFAFASLLHLPREDIREVFKKIATVLHRGGIFYISLKEQNMYEKELKSDQFGERLFYYYTVPLIEELDGGDFEKVYEDHQVLGHTRWFTIALKKIR